MLFLDLTLLQNYEQIFGQSDFLTENSTECPGFQGSDKYSQKDCLLHWHREVMLIVIPYVSMLGEFTLYDSLLLI